MPWHTPGQPASSGPSLTTCLPLGPFESSGGDEDPSSAGSGGAGLGRDLGILQLQPASNNRQMPHPHFRRPVVDKASVCDEAGTSHLLRVSSSFCSGAGRVSAITVESALFLLDSTMICYLIDAERLQALMDGERMHAPQQKIGMVRCLHHHHSQSSHHSESARPDVVETRGVAVRAEFVRY